MLALSRHRAAFSTFCRAAGPNAGILERLFAFDTANLPLEPSPSLRIVQAAGRYREVERIGSEIADLRARGENVGDVSVVVRHIETYGEMIEDVFSRYGIPHQFETGVPLLRVPFIKYWFALMDLVTSDRERASLTRVMSTLLFGVSAMEVLHSMWTTISWTELRKARIPGAARGMPRASVVKQKPQPAPRA